MDASRTADVPLLGAVGLSGAEKYVSAEVVYAATHEGALHVDDVLTRRTHIAFEVPDRGLRAADSVARLMAPVLAWDEASIDQEIAHYRAHLEAEPAAQAMLAAASNSARAEVRDPRLGSSPVAAGQMGNAPWPGRVPFATAAHADAR